jgi:TetR/AcrR family transcriptional repressor of nem operon
MPTSTSSGARRPESHAGANDTAERILDVAEPLVQRRGFNAFSYADVAAELGISKAGVHHHFASKAELGAALVSRYARTFSAALAAIDAEAPGAPAKLAAYTGLYADVLRHRRMCLCGMLAAEYEALPEPISEAIVAFFDENETWLIGVLQRGRADETLSFQGSPRDEARVLISGLEGAMLVARPYDDVERFELTTSRMLGNLFGADLPTRESNNPSVFPATG